MLELGRDVEDCDPLLALVEERVLHELDGAYVEALTRLRRDQNLGVVLDFTGQDQFLLVAAGKESGLLANVLQAHVVTTHQTAGVLENGPEI